MIDLVSFRGIAPGIAPTNLADTAATVANNCLLSSTVIRPIKEPAFVSTPTKAGVKKTIFPYSNVFLHWLEDVDVARSPINGDAWGRVFWTGEGVPKYSVNTIITAGGTNYPTNSYPLGLPVPPNNATVTPEEYSAAKAYTQGCIVRYGGGDYIANAAVGPEAWNDAHWTALEVNQSEAYSYVWRFVTMYGEVGPPSLPTVPVTCGIGQARTLTDCPVKPGGNTTITKKWLYRTLTDTTGDTVFRFCLEAAIEDTTVVDSVKDSALTDTLPEADWIAPPADLKGLINCAYGGLAGYSGNRLCLTPPNEPHAWPVEYQYTFPYPVVAIGSYGNTILVTTTGFAYIVYGTDPASMRQERLEEGEACLSKRGLADMGDAILYPSALGLMMVSGERVENVTHALMTGKEWVSLFKPSMLSAYRHEGRYIAFHDTGGFIFDPATKDLTTIDLVATAGYLDPVTANLYLVVGNDIVKWDASNTAMTATWRSKTYITNPMNPGAAKVRADGYPITFKLYADGALKYTKTVTSVNPFTLPSKYLATSWYVEVSGQSQITDVKVAATMDEIQR